MMNFQTAQRQSATAPAFNASMGAASKVVESQLWEVLSFSARATTPPEIRPARSSASGISFLPLKIWWKLVIPTILKCWNL